MPSIFSYLATDFQRFSLMRCPEYGSEASYEIEFFVTSNKHGVISHNDQVTQVKMRLFPIMIK